MKVSELMTKQAASCELDTSLAAAVKHMMVYGCGFLPVIGEGGNVIAVITDRDISIALGTSDGKATQMFVRDVVLPPKARFPKLFTCTPDDDMHSALETMQMARVRRLPVVNVEGELLGVLSLDDLVLKACQHAGKHGLSCADVIRTYQAIERREQAERIVPQHPPHAATVCGER